jgi:glyoxylase-like metal-dependent hydrolase (beta-lactamase superfamily II)
VPLARRQAPSFYRCKVGEFEVTVVNDGARAIPLPAQFVRNVSNEQVLAAAEAAYMPKGSIIAPFNPIVVNTGAKLVLIDTGYGPGLGPTVGLLPSTLAAAGFDPKAIDIVLISHMHGDHILGLKTPDGALAFPDAEIKVPAIDWAFWMNDDNMSRAPEGFTKTSFGFNRKIFSNLTDKVTRYEWGREVAPGITAVETRGHTPPWKNSCDAPDAMTKEVCPLGVRADRVSLRATCVLFLVGKAAFGRPTTASDSCSPAATPRSSKTYAPCASSG